LVFLWEQGEEEDGEEVAASSPSEPPADPLCRACAAGPGEPCAPAQGLQAANEMTDIGNSLRNKKKDLECGKTG